MSQASASPTSPKTRSTPILVYVMLLLAVGAFSAAPILVRYAQGSGIPSTMIAAGRLLIASLVLLPFTLSRYASDLRGLTKRQIILLVTSGFFLAMHFWAWTSSLEYTSVLLSTIFGTSSPLWVALLEWFILREKLSRPVLIGLGVALVGGVMIGFAGSLNADSLTLTSRGDFIGGFLALIGAVAVGIHYVIGRSVRQSLPALPYIWTVNTAAALILSLVVLIEGHTITDYAPIGYLWVLGVALIPQLIGHSSLNYAFGYLPATLVSMVTLTEPIGSAILAFFLFSEIPLPLQIIGSAVVLMGIMLANIGRARRKKASS